VATLASENQRDIGIKIALAAEFSIG